MRLEAEFLSRNIERVWYSFYTDGKQYWWGKTRYCSSHIECDRLSFTKASYNDMLRAYREETTLQETTHDR